MSDLRQSIMDLAEETRFSGVVRVDVGGSTIFSGAFGLAHRGIGFPNTVDTQFALASGGKGFTALAVVSLIEEGALSFDTAARALLRDDLPLIAEDVTVEHLLGHTSGIGDYLDEEDDGAEPTDYVLASPIHALSTTEAFIPELDGHPTKFAAGERFGYSNAGYVVLALIAERASGTPYHQLVEERVLEPAGLSDTGFLRSDEPSGRMALGYLLDDGDWTNVHHLPVKGNGDGGIYSTAADMESFWRALMSGGIVGRASVARMTEPRSDPPEENVRYGLGFWLAQRGPGVKLIGGDAGVSFSSYHDPSTAVTWTVLSNSTDGAWRVTPMLRDRLGG